MVTVKPEMVSLVTVRRHIAFFPPSVVVTVMSAVPSVTAVTFPAESTFATAVLLLVHATDLSRASVGLTVAVSCFVSPGFIAAVDALRLTPVTLLAGNSRTTVTFSVPIVPVRLPPFTPLYTCPGSALISLTSYFVPAASCW